MKHTLLSLLVLALALGATQLSAQTTNWSIDGTKVQLNGENFLFRGVNYAPVPYGATPEFTPPYGSYFIPKARPIWERDIALMRDMGVNCIRLYAGTTNVADGLDLADYQQFFDALYNNGTDPIYVFMYYYHEVGHEAIDNGNFGNTKNGLTALMTRWKDHPAVAGIVIGNETEGGPEIYDRQQYWQGVGDICDALKQIAPNKLTMNAMIDDGSGDNKSAKVQSAFKYREYLDNLDIIGINCYRGPDLGTKAGASGGASSNSVFLGYARSWTSNPKPLMITEFGVSWGTGGQNVREANSAAQKDKGADYLRENWTAISNNYKGQDGDPAVVAGGFVFSWVDEWYKIYINGNATPTTHDSNRPVATEVNFPGGQKDEEWYGIMRIDESKNNPNSGSWDINNLRPDTLIKRSTYGALQKMWKVAFKSAFTAQAGGGVTANENGTYESWFGTVYEDEFPWVYQTELDWVYVEPGESETDGKAWVWDQTFEEWFWVSEEVFPWMYRLASESWIYYIEGTDNPQFYWDSATGEFFQHD